ncbi:UNVERIFIED_CONTAM: hypothetical protein K2H54_036825 [Gekko kuhli]
MYMKQCRCQERWFCQAIPNGTSNTCNLEGAKYRNLVAVELNSPENKSITLWHARVLFLEFRGEIYCVESRQLSFLNAFSTVLPSIVNLLNCGWELHVLTV